MVGLLNRAYSAIACAKRFGALFLAAAAAALLFAANASAGEPAAAGNQSAAPGAPPAADALSSATFDISDVRSLRFDEASGFGFDRFRSGSPSADALEKGDFWVAYEETGTDVTF